MKKKSIKKFVVIYQAKSGAIQLRGDFDKETLWASRMQMAEIFGVNPQAITKHLQHIYKEKELFPSTTSSKMELVQSEAGRMVKRTIDVYNLDAVIAVGYRINSVMGTKFRVWATSTLRAHLIKGYTINRSRIAKNYDTFLRAVEQVKALLPSSGAADTDSVLELIKLFASTWFSLDAYDKSALIKSGATKKQVTLAAKDLSVALLVLKKELISKGQATELFGAEKQRDSIGGIVGNVLQSFGGTDLYPSVEEKAAHLLYFIVKNHVFADGNKRSGAFAFVWLLRKARILNTARLTPEALTALTLLVAESDPKEKDRVIWLVLTLLKK